MMKDYRKMLEEIGGYENDMVAVNAGAVRNIIDDLERTLKEKAQLAEALERLINKVNKITSNFRHDNPISHADLILLSDRQIESEKALAKARGEK